MRKSAAPRLRTSMLLLITVLASVALGASTALVGLTVTLARQTALVGQADARMRASLRTRAALLWFARASDSAAARHSSEALEAQSRAEAELRESVDETRRLATPERAIPLDHLVRKAGEFIALRERLQSEGLGVALILERASSALDSALHDLEDLVSADDAFSRTQQITAHRLSSVAVTGGASAAGFLLLGFAAAIVASRRLVERPILALDRVVERFGSGDSRARAASDGVFEIRKIAASFNDLADRVLRQEKDRLTFLASIAHDLRGPLTPLKLTLDRLERGPQPPPEKSYVQVMSLVQRQVDRLDQMVGDLLEGTRIQSGEFELHRQWVDLRPIVQDVADLYRPISEPCHIDVRAPDEPIMASCDPMRIEQVLINLVSNALKYSPDGGLITIELSIDAGEVVIAVSDEGVGIAPQDRERIFQPFQRGEKARETAGGAGLGLSASRKIAEAHGGQLVAESPGSGATLRLRLPLKLALDETVRIPASEAQWRAATQAQ